MDTINSVAMEHVQPVLENFFQCLVHRIFTRRTMGRLLLSHKFGEFADQWGFKHRKVTLLWLRAYGSAESVMPKLGKVLKTCEVTSIDRNVGLNMFFVQSYTTLIDKGSTVFVVFRDFVGYLVYLCWTITERT